ncbi:MAG: tyrosine-type recombinase/integrase [Rhodoferax sp.]|nr:tyrosine-type recombinase/integrase [Rhodoferax sp.]
MIAWPEDNGDAIERHVRQLRPRSLGTVRVYRCILLGFQRFVQQSGCVTAINSATIEAWLRDRTKRWPMHLVLHRARIVDRFLDFLASEESIPHNPFEQLRVRYGQRAGTPIVRALLAADCAQALEAQRPVPRFASFLGSFMREHVERMQAIGYRYATQTARFLRFDRFLQGRPDLADQSPAVLLQQWAAESPTLNHACECQHVGRSLAKARRRLDPSVELPQPDRHLTRQLAQQRRRPYIYTPQEVRLLLDTALKFPSPRSPLRPFTLHTMIVLAYCAGLRLGEFVRLTLNDVHLDVGEISICGTKFFKSRTLPLTDSVMAALREYLELRRRAGASQDESSGLFWRGPDAAASYSYVMTEHLLVSVLRRAGLKPETGRVGPRVHDLRHAFVVNRMLEWYRNGINPQARLPYLATYLGHKDINSTLVYLTITQELLQQASERFRAFAAHATEGDPK